MTKKKKEKLQAFFPLPHLKDCTMQLLLAVLVILPPPFLLSQASPCLGSLFEMVPTFPKL